MDAVALRTRVVADFPQLDHALVEYVCGVVESAAPADVYDDDAFLFEAVSPVLLSAGGYEAEVRAFCDAVRGAVLADAGRNGRAVQEAGQRRLETSLVLVDAAAEAARDVERMLELSADRPRAGVSYVDQRKLARAEAKSQEKLERRRTGDVAEEQGRPVAGAPAAALAGVTQAAVKGEQVGKDVRLLDFDVTFGGKTLLKGASVTLAADRHYGLVGRNGIGKSTLLRAISSGTLAVPPQVSILHVEQEVVGDETAAVDSVLEADTERSALLEEERRLIHGAESRPAEPAEALHQEKLAAVYARLAAIDADRAPARACTILSGLGFTPEMQRAKTKSLSGGWRMRIALARALFARPVLLLLDEPTNMLDVGAVVWLEGYLRLWTGTLLVVSHDRAFLNAVCTDTLHMVDQRIDAYRGDYDAFEQARKEKLLNQQREYEKQQVYRQELQAFIDRWRYNAKRASLAQSKIKILEKLPVLQPVTAERAVVFRFPDPPDLAASLIQFDDVTFDYKTGAAPVLSRVTFGASPRTRACVVGANGQGKTTLLRLVIGELEATAGQVTRNGKLRIGYFAQHHVDALTMDVTPVEFLRGKWPGRDIEEYRRQLGAFGVTGDMALQRISTLSGGQKSRLAFASLAMAQPHLLALDEPTNHLDVETVGALIVALRHFTGGVVLVSHDERLVSSVCNELWVCGEGTVRLFDGGFAAYRDLLKASMQF